MLEYVGLLVLEYVRMLVSERISDTSVEDEIEDADVRVCWDAGVGEDRERSKSRCWVSRRWC